MKQQISKNAENRAITGLKCALNIQTMWYCHFFFDIFRHAAHTNIFLVNQYQQIICRIDILVKLLRRTEM